MGESVADGVVNSDCQVFDPGTGSQGVYAGLRIVDGSIAPASIGVNPLLTIAAIAERTASRFQG